MENLNFKVNEIEVYHLALKNHSMYRKIKNFEQLKVFMETHMFAVWDFMSLLKRLQRELTCVEVPWKPSIYSKNIVRLINSIVLGEESDLDQNGDAIDHFSLYLKAMDEIGANYIPLINFIETFQYEKLSSAQKNFVQFNLNLANNGKIHEVAAGFFYGREKLIPDMFTALLNDLKNNIVDSNQYKNLIYYLERHIEIDGDEHSHQAFECLKELCGNDSLKWSEAYHSGIDSLKLRIALWDEVESKI